MKIIPLITLRIGKADNFKTIAPNKAVDLPDDAEAESLIERGFANPVSSVAVSSSNPPDSSDELIEAIVDAIADLSPENFGQDGKPAVKAIEEIIEQKVSALDRDKAWEVYQSLVSNGQ